MRQRGQKNCRCTGATRDPMTHKREVTYYGFNRG